MINEKIEEDQMGWIIMPTHKNDLKSALCLDGIPIVFPRRKNALEVAGFQRIECKVVPVKLQVRCLGCNAQLGSTGRSVDVTHCEQCAPIATKESDPKLS